MRKGTAVFLRNNEFSGNNAFTINKMNVEGVSLSTPNAENHSKAKKLEKPFTSSSVLDGLAKVGMSHSQINYRVYNDSAYGKLRGVEFYSTSMKRNPVLRDYTHAQINEGVGNIYKQMVGESDGTKIPKNDLENTWFAEMDDYKKLAFQDIRPFGYHIDDPIRRESQNKKYPARYLEIVRILVRYAVDMYRKAGKLTEMDLKTTYVDPDKSNTGMPFCFSGSDDTDVYRTAILSVMPPFNYKTDNRDYFQLLFSKFSQLGVPPEAFMTSYMVTRTGPSVKPVKLFDLAMTGWTSSYEVENYAARMRFAWAAPYYFYMMSSVGGAVMKRARMATPGAYHTEDMVGQSYKRLNFNPSNTLVSNDFSQYDRSITVELQSYLFSLFGEFVPEWTNQFDILQYFIENVKMVMPSFTVHDSKLVSVFSGKVPLLSGINITPEIGTFLGIASTLHALEHFIDADVVDKYITGKFCIMEQSDDNIYSLPKAQAEKLLSIKDELITFVEENHGFQLKINFGNVFLKRILPYGVSSLAETSPVLSRVIQNTMAGEYELTHKFADTIAQFGFIARCYGLRNHPMIKANPKLLYAFLEFFDQSSVLRPVLDTVGKPVTALPQTVLDKVAEFCATAQGQKWLDDLIQRSGFDIVASSVLDTFATFAGDLYTQQLLRRTERRASFLTSLENPVKSQRDDQIYSELLRLRVQELLR